MRIKSVLSWFVVLALFAGLVFGITQHQAIYDWLKLRGYNPSSRIVQLADETTMKDDTRRVFYVNHPELDEKREFNERCQSTEQTIVLGCFIDNKGIYLLNVTDPRLSGVVEVTAAHETLHAMYARLDKNERKKVDEMTEKFFATLNDERIKKTVENYRSKDPSVVPNELHSILGTEVRNLSPELEEYYKQYFGDRGKIVTYSEKYEQTFVDLENQAQRYDNQLAGLKQKVDNNRKIIEDDNRDIDEKQKQLNILLEANKIDEYNSQVASYNRLVNEYNALVNETKQLIDEYNALLEERNALVIQQQQLYQVIDSNSINEEQER